VTPTLSLLIPTHREDRPLRRALDSVRTQLRDGDEVLVVGDTHDGPMPAVEALVAEFGAPYRYLEHDAGAHDFGHSQLNYGISQAKGDYIHVNDDDDVWTPDALAAFREMASAVHEPMPFLFRFKSYVGLTFWVEPGTFARNWIGGHCLLMPNVPGKLGRFGPQYNGDYDYVESAVNHYGGPWNVAWVDRVVAIARPA
jgi:glycosyltransferase involved in cell wall biosynthesis